MGSSSPDNGLQALEDSLHQHHKRAVKIYRSMSADTLLSLRASAQFDKSCSAQIQRHQSGRTHSRRVFFEIRDQLVLKLRIDGLGQGQRALACGFGFLYPVHFRQDSSKNSLGGCIVWR
jgi:hypothetical protein